MTRQPGRTPVRAARPALVVMLLALIAGMLPAPALATPAPAPVAPAVAPAAVGDLTSSIRLRVEDLDTHDAITSYLFLISRDDTGNPTDAAASCFPDKPGGNPIATNPDYPANCDWPSVHSTTGGAGGAENLVTTGDQAELNDAAGLDLPDGNYLISVVADGHKIDGAWFTIPMAATSANPDTALITVGLHPDPLPFGTLRIQVFADTSTNGQFDPQNEVGLAGFKGHIADVLGEVTTDWFGNPLCAKYDNAGEYIAGTGGKCLSDANGVITIPNLGSNRYSASVVPPTGQTWIQTTTLEGAHDWDTWVYEGYQGYDQEMIVNGGSVPVAQFGFVQPKTLPSCGGCGRVTGRVISTKSYLPAAGGDTDEGPVSKPWIAISDLQSTADDQLVYAGRGLADGTFSIGNLPNSTYQVTMWDNDQNLLLAVTTVVIDGSGTVDIGDFALSHWFSEVHGKVFVDTNGDGKWDPGERGLAQQPVVLKSRDNAIVDAGSKVATTDLNGNYVFKQVYPYGYWTVLESYNDRYYTTGVTYQADNGPARTVLGAGVDVSVLNQDGLSSRIDWGVLPYAPGENGGIVGEVVYNMTRNELDARLAATEDYEPGIPNMTVNLYQPVPCGTTQGKACSADGMYEIEADKSYSTGPLLNQYITESFKRPQDCQARDAAGNPLDLPFMSLPTGGYECIESPLMGNQIKTGPSEAADPPDFTLVNGNYGFADGCFAGEFDPDTGSCTTGDFATLTPGDYLVQVQSPMDLLGRHPAFKVSREEDINVFDGDQFGPLVPPPACAGAMHTVDVADIGPDGPDATVNPTFVEVGGSPYEGLEMPLCDMRLVPLGDQRSIAPSFSYFTDVPLPGRLFGAVVEDLALGTNPNEFYYGEKAGIPNAPLGFYDYSGRLVHTIQSDPNGFFEVLLPSTRTFNCPLPAGPCPNIYRLVGNDPGQPGHPNPNYLPQFRTFESDWQIWPGLTLLADVAIIQASPVIEVPGTQTTHPPSCTVETDTNGNPIRPDLFAVSVPYVVGGGSFTIDGQGFGTGGEVTLDGTPIDTANWSDRHIDASVPGTIPVGSHQLLITRSDNGMTSVNGLTFHVLGTGYSPTLYEVGPGHPYATIQAAIEAASSDAHALVVVYPNTPGAFTPLGDYYESIVIHSALKLQGVGPGGTRADGSFVLGSILNGLGFANTNFAAWQALVEGLRSSPGWAGNQDVYEGQVIYVLASSNGFGADYRAQIDGLSIRGGDEFGYPSSEPVYPVQGGGIYVNGYARHLEITNNKFQGNGGAYGGAIRLGTPYIGSNHNDDVRIAHNRILGNGGSNLAGAVALFAGSNGYEIDHNDICGNFSAEYGGGISHFGLSSSSGPVARIHDNRLWFNGSYDEGGGIILAGELPSAEGPATLSPGSGPVDIRNNVIQANLADDDGGGIRLLMAGNFPISIVNNIIANNVSTHEGGGIALDDATRVRIVNNTIVRNLTTATAATSNHLAAPAGLSDTGNSDLLQATLPAGHAPYSDPLLFNNIFWDNRAGTYDAGTNTITGIGLAGAADIDLWDQGVVGPGALHPTNSVLQENTRSVITPSATNTIGVDPQLKALYDLTVEALPWRGGGGQFVFVHMVTDDAPPGQIGDYHLAQPSTSSPAHNKGVAIKSGVLAPHDDIDGDYRPAFGGFEAGADEDPGGVPDLSGPVVSGLLANPAVTNGNTVITGSASDAGTGDNIIAAAEWFEGNDPGPGNGNPFTATDGEFDSATEPIQATISPSLLASQGDHTVKVRALDGAGNWSAISLVVYRLDRVPPAVTSAAVASINSGQNLRISARINDTGNFLFVIASRQLDHRRGRVVRGQRPGGQRPRDGSVGRVLRHRQRAGHAHHSQVQPGRGHAPDPRPRTRRSRQLGLGNGRDGDRDAQATRLRSDHPRHPHGVRLLDRRPQRLDLGVRWLEPRRHQGGRTRRQPGAARQAPAPQGRVRPRHVAEPPHDLPREVPVRSERRQHLRRLPGAVPRPDQRRDEPVRGPVQAFERPRLLRPHRGPWQARPRQQWLGVHRQPAQDARDRVGRQHPRRDPAVHQRLPAGPGDHEHQRPAPR